MHADECERGAVGEDLPRPRPIKPKDAKFLDGMDNPETLPAWLSEADLDFSTAEFARTGFRGGREEAPFVRDARAQVREELEDLVEALGAVAPPRAEPAQSQVLEDGEVRQDGPLLGHPRDPASRDLVRTEPRDVLAEDPVLTSSTASMGCAVVVWRPGTSAGPARSPGSPPAGRRRAPGPGGGP